MKPQFFHVKSTVFPWLPVLRGAGVAEPDLLEAQAVPRAGAAGGGAACGLHLVWLATGRIGNSWSFSMDFSYLVVHPT